MLKLLHFPAKRSDIRLNVLCKSCSVSSELLECHIVFVISLGLNRNTSGCYQKPVFFNPGDVYGYIHGVSTTLTVNSSDLDESIWDLQSVICWSFRYKMSLDLEWKWDHTNQNTEYHSSSFSLAFKFTLTIFSSFFDIRAFNIKFQCQIQIARYSVVHLVSPAF